MSEPVPPPPAARRVLPAEAGSGAPEAGRARREPAPPPAAPSAEPIDDRLVRAIGIPAFGLGIPHLTGLLAGVPLASAVHVAGLAWFLLLAAAIWHGNRWLLFEQRRHYGWFDHPARKVVLLLAANVLFTAPLTIVSLLAWYGWRGLPPDVAVIRTVVLVNVICVVFVTHVYETVFLIKERERDLVRVAALDRARAEAELAAFLAQVDPHFLFNSLNTLGHLIDTAPARARRFSDDLADLYRYLLRQRGQALVPLAEEVAFMTAYVDLLRIRFGDALACHIHDDGADLGLLIPPTALQLLVENAIKHNELGADHPLAIDVHLGPDRAVVRNRTRPRRSVRPGAGVGLRNLDERAFLTTGRRLRVSGDGEFVVEVPLGARP
jgi:hypothetical protein